MIDPPAKDSMLLEETTVETEDKMEEKVDSDVLNKSMESIDSLEHFQLRISDDESTNKHGGSPNQEAPEDLENRMDVDQSSDNCKTENAKLEEGCNNFNASTPCKDSAKSTSNVMECEIEEDKTPLTNGISGSENEEETNDKLTDENLPEKVKSDEELVKISTSEENGDVPNKEQKEESTENDNEKTEKTEDNEVILNNKKPNPTSEDDDRSTGETDSTDGVSKQPVENSTDNDKTMDEDSKTADQSNDGFEGISEAKKRQRLADDSECESIETGTKKIKKNFFSGMPQSEEQINQEIKSLDDKLNSLDVLKDSRNKAASLSDEESRHHERDKAREKQMRENVLRVIQRDYQNMSVEDFEDAIYVAIMDYFCNYNPSALLQRKVLMLEKLVATLQENYHRTVKQFSEAKYLLKRMVEIRKDDLSKCSCQNKVPFKLIRSVAVQVQTSRCRGGDFCPGSEDGLRPKTKQPPDTNLNGLKQKKTNPPTPFSNKENSQSSSTTTPVSQQPAAPRHISVSVPPNRMLLRQKSSTDLQNVPPTAGTSTPQSTPRRPTQVVLSKTNGASPPKTNSSFVIDLTDKEEEVIVKKAAVSTPPPSAVNTKPTTPVQQPIQTRVVKTSVLSPMPQLPPLPPAPYYKASVRRPPQPVLKVCKADQSGIMLSWTLRTNVPLPNEILFYQVYACQENAGVTREWSTVGDVKALPLPMACTLSQFREGHRYHFVVRAVDRYKVLGEFSHPASILLVSKSGGTSNHAVAAASTSHAR